MSNEQKGTNCIVQGRIIWTSGDLFKGEQVTDYNSKQPKLNADGTPKMQYGFGLAVELPNPNRTDRTPQDQERITKNFTEIWTAIHTEAYTMFPSRIIPPNFAMKYKKPEDIDDKGVPYSQRSTYKDHYVFACTTSLAIKFYRFENGAYVQCNDGIKCGDYVQVHLNIKAHPAINNGKAGLYVNPSAVLFLQAGEAIVNSPAPETLFGSQAPQMMPGIPMIAQAPTAPMPTGVPQFAASTAPPQYAPPVAQQPQAQPHYGVLPQVHQPQVPNGYAAPTPPTASPNGYSNGQMTPSMPTAPQPQVYAAPPAYNQAPAPQGYAQPAAPMGMPTPGMPPFPGQQ